MSTTITVKTHDWPVEATLYNSYVADDYSNNSTTVKRVKPYSEQSFSITQHQTAFFRELQRPSPDA